MANGQAPGTHEDTTDTARELIMSQLTETAQHLRTVANVVLVEPDDYVVMTGFLDSSGQGCLMLQEVAGRDRLIALQALKTWVDARIAENTH